MTINNPDAYVAGIWDWGILGGCFGQTKIEPADVDGLVERNGKFLLIEAKGPTADLKQGQRITYEALQKTGVFSILIVWGDTNKPERMELWTRSDKVIYNKAGLQKFREIVSKWFAWADGESTYG